MKKVYDVLSVEKIEVARCACPDCDSLGLSAGCGPGDCTEVFADNCVGCGELNETQ